MFLEKASEASDMVEQHYALYRLHLESMCEQSKLDKTKIKTSVDKKQVLKAMTGVS